ncbi:MAG: adenine deaminase [Acetivibrio sp.]
MVNKFCQSPLWETSKNLSAVAMGYEPADTVITNVKLINVCSREILPDMQVAIKKGRIALVGDAGHCIGEETEVIDGKGQYIAPGFMDGHIHLEGTMLNAGEYAKVVVPHGTTAVFMDPHEICNVLGLNGVKQIIKEAMGTPLKAMLTISSCVPTVPGFEDTGSFIGIEEIKEAMSWDCTVGLGEMMNFTAVNCSDSKVHELIGETLKAGKIVTGHYPVTEVGNGLNAYIASGVRCCHESSRAEDALEKMRHGMYAMLRESSAWRDLHEVLKSITKKEIDSRYALLVSDNTHADTLLSKGHLDHIVKRGVEEGLDVLTAIQMVTINCAQCFQLDHELGSISPSKCADIVFIDDLENLNITKVMVDGRVVAENGKMTGKIKPYHYPKETTASIHIKDKISPLTFQIDASKEAIKKGMGKVRTIEIEPNKASTKEKIVELKVQNSEFCVDVEQDILKAAVFERHHNTGKIGLGFVKGFGIHTGAVASTVAHDAHNLIVLGTNDRDMSIASNELIACGGGMIVIKDGQVLAKIPLPIAGLMSDQPAKKVGELILSLKEAWKEIGCELESPFMTMALLGLASIPDIRLTNRGLIDTQNMSRVQVEVEKES